MYDLFLVACLLAYGNLVIMVIYGNYCLRFFPTDVGDFTCLAGFFSLMWGDFTCLPGEREK